MDTKISAALWYLKFDDLGAFLLLEALQRRLLWIWLSSNYYWLRDVLRLPESLIATFMLLFSLSSYDGGSMSIAAFSRSSILAKLGSSRQVWIEWKPRQVLLSLLPGRELIS